MPNILTPKIETDDDLVRFAQQVAEAIRRELKEVDPKATLDVVPCRKSLLKHERMLDDTHWTDIPRTDIPRTDGDDRYVVSFSVELNGHPLTCQVNPGPHGGTAVVELRVGISPDFETKPFADLLRMFKRRQQS